MIKKLYLVFLMVIMCFCGACAGQNQSDIYSDGTSDKQEESVREPSDSEESTDSDTTTEEEDSSDDTSSPEKDDSSSEEEPPQEEDNDWTFIY